MKILMITPAFIPSEFGGVKMQSYYLAKWLAKRGHKITVYTSNACNRGENLDRLGIYVIDGINVIYFKNCATNEHFFQFFFPGIVTYLKRNLKEYDIVHLHDYRTFQNIVVHHYARKYGVPYVLHAHGSLPRIITKKRLKRIYDFFFGYRLLSDASKVIALNPVEAQQYRNMGVPQDKIDVIPNGIDLSEYTYLPPKGYFKKKFSIGDDEKIVLYLGRIHASKGLDLLAEAFSVVSKKFEKVRLVVVGPDGGYAEKFRRLISDLGIKGKALLTGFVEKGDKFAALVDSDVFVTPYFHGFPVTFLEACLVGCPIVTASDELDWIHDNVGYVVENPPIALAKAISNILQDESTRKRFENNCRYVIKNFDISTVTSQLEEAYESVVKWIVV